MLNLLRNARQGPDLALWRAVNRGWTLRRLRRYRRQAVADGDAAPAFDLRRYNPMHWPRAAANEVALLGPPGLLPPGAAPDPAHRQARSRDPRRLRRYHHIIDAAGFHADTASRASLLARLAANGVVVHALTGSDDGADARLRAHLGDELYGLITANAYGLDAGERELRSIAMRRAALRGHSAWGRHAAGLPAVSILLATRRPALLPQALAAAARQTYPKLELSLALHGAAEAFAGVEGYIKEMPFPVRVTRAPADATLGAVLNAAVAASAGDLVTKLDDDDCYGPEHVWDLVLAREYSGARLVGKGVEFVYLAASGQTLHCRSGRGEAYRSSSLAGGTLLISRQDLERVGGWREVPRGVDTELVNAVLRRGGGVYRTHGAGYILVRHGHGHTWPESEARFIAKADRIIPGWAPAAAGLPDAPLPPVAGFMGGGKAAADAIRY